MRDVLILWCVALLAGGCWLLMRKPRKTMAGDMDAPMDLDRARARSEAAMAAPITEADEEAAEPLVAFVEEISTGEQPIVELDEEPETDEFPAVAAFGAFALEEPIPDGYVMESETFFNNLAADRLSAFTWATPVRTTVALSSVQVVEPDPLELESFTGTWTRAEFAALAARAEAVNAR